MQYIVFIGKFVLFLNIGSIEVERTSGMNDSFERRF
jgi:hypothetical protein